MRKAILIVVGLVVVALVLTVVTAGFWVNWLWFGSLGLRSVLVTQYEARLALFAGGGLVAALFFGLNVRVAARQLLGKQVLVQGQEITLAPRLLTLAVLAGSLAVGVLLGLAAAAEWPGVLAFLHRTGFGVTEPIYHRDVGFYVFTLPLLEALRSWLLGLFILTLLAVGLFGFLAYGQNLAQRRFSLPPAVRGHLSLLGALTLALLAFSYWLANFDLLYSTRGVAFGVGRTDDVVQRPANYILLGLSLLVALLLAWNAFARRLRPLISAVVVWAIAAVVVGVLIPAGYQSTYVKPSELRQETPYILNNIALTRKAYGLDNVTTGQLAGDAPLDQALLDRNAATTRNIRLWDYRPLLTTYQQIQRIRQYYEFTDVDIDRYQLNGNDTEVMLSARELDPNQLPSKTWINQHLIYTHGYGVVVSPVNAVTEQGLPDLLVQDLPPTGQGALAIARPQIYYGEQTDNYAIVGTREREFDRPGKAGEPGEVYTRYDGPGGVPVSGFLNKLIFAAGMGDSNILLSSSLTDGSRILYHRQIADRVQRVAPFLTLDHDPYLVILDGKLLWVQDAYTATDRYPYAEPAPGQNFNYLRNSVKVTIDAYTGELHFYVVDDSDPLLQTYRKIYPDLFTPLSAAPAGLTAHFRYPEDLFNVQADIYATYHMSDPQVFYNKEDLWKVASETYGEQVQRMEAYYVLMQLPGQSQAEFALILPFTPAGNNRTNMVSWMVARSDGAHYGQLQVYQFPQDKFIFGPQQIEARINQEPDISTQLTLWGQGGSRVIRGNLLVFPMGESLLYVQPLYLQASSSPLPELKRVIVASSQGVVMSDRLDTALGALAQGRNGIVLSAPGGPVQTAPSGTPPAGGAAPGNAAQLAQQALDHYQKAQDALKRGDWTTYGQELQAMQQILEQLAGK